MPFLLMGKDVTFIDESATVDKETMRSVDDLVESVGWLRRCIDIRAQALSTVPFVVTDSDGNQVDYPQHQLAQLLQLTEESLLVNAEAYWQVEPLRWLSPKSMSPLWDKKQGLRGFKRQGRRIPLLPRDVAYFYVPDVNSETRKARPLAEVAALSANVLYETSDFVRRYMQGGATPTTVLKMRGNPKRSEMSRLERWWKKATSGVRKPNDVVAMRSDVEIESVGGTTKDAQVDQVMDTFRKEVSATMGVPYTLVASDSANYATATEDKRTLYESTVVPRAMMLEGEINRKLFEPKGLRFRFAPEQLPVFRQDEGERSQALRNYTDAGVPIEQAMTMLGITPPTVDSTTVDEEVKRFKRWYKARKRKRGDVDATRFKSDVLTTNEILSIAYELENKGKVE